MDYEVLNYNMLKKLEKQMERKKRPIKQRSRKFVK